MLTILNTNNLVGKRFLGGVDGVQIWKVTRVWEDRGMYYIEIHLDDILFNLSNLVILNRKPTEDKTYHLHGLMSEKLILAETIENINEFLITVSEVTFKRKIS